MSDVSQGPGWWQASDGKWYPPEQAATPPPTEAFPPPTQTEQFPSSQATQSFATPPTPPQQPAAAQPPVPNQPVAQQPTAPGATPAGWYPAPNDPPGTQRYWDGAQWVGAPQVVAPGGPVAAAPQALVTPHGLPLADPWPRIGARLLDGLLVGMVSLILALVMLSDGITGGLWSSGGYLFVSLLLGAGYEIGFVGAMGATPGKLLLNLRVVDQETGTTPPGWDKAALRWLPALVGLIPILGGLASLAIVVLSVVWLFSDEARRTVYDRIATTYVVRNPTA